MGFRPYRSPRRPLIQRDTRDFSARGEYTPVPGRGPYPWRQAPPLYAVDFSGDGWVAAAGTSEHVQSFRFVYGLDRLIVGGGGRLGFGGVQIRRENEGSVLQVRFKGGWAVYWSLPNSQYTAERLEAIYLMMESAAHPGQIIWSHLIGKDASVQWPYDTSAS